MGIHRELSVQLTGDHILGGLATVSFGVCGFFLKRLVDKVDASATKHDMVNLEKRIEAFEHLLSNLSRDVSRDMAVIRTELQWNQKYMHDKLKTRHTE